MDYQKYATLAVDFIIKNAFNLLIATIIFIVGMWIVKKAVIAIKVLMEKRNVELTLQKFLGDVITWTLKMLVFIVAISQLGVETTSFIALLGAAGLAVGLALQGSLSNFAGGTLIMIFKPFKIGDNIEAQGHRGTVKEIKILFTKMITPQNKTIIIPNGILSNGTLVNHTDEPILRVDLSFSIGYGEDIKKAREVLLEEAAKNPEVLKDPAPMVHLAALADSSVNVTLKTFVLTENYWNVYNNLGEEGKIALDNAGIEIPFPHRVLIQK